MSDETEPVDPGALIRLSVIRLFLAHKPEDCEIIKCLDTKTGLTCDVLFIPAMDPDTGDIHMTPAFAIPESNLSDQEDRYIPLDTLPKTSPIDFKNN
jgi:hypothetical protein